MNLKYKNKYLLQLDTMASHQETNTIQVYFKIPYTEITSVVVVQNLLIMREFLEYVNIDVRNNLHINQRYDIELVDTGKEGEN